MNWTGKKIVVLGDSITEGAGASSEQNVYHQLLKRMLGLSELISYGIGGTRIARQTVPSEFPLYDLDFNKRAPEMDSDADLVIVFGGTNDFGHGDAPLGNKGDDTVYTFYGACKCLFDTLVQKYGKNKIVVVTPMHRIGEDNVFGDGSKVKASAPMYKYIDALLNVANEEQLKVLNLWADDDLNLHICDIVKYFCDGLHPNDSGHRLIAEKMAIYLKSL